MIHLMAYVALIGLADYAFQTLVPMEAQFKKIVHVIAVIAAVFVVLQGTGLLAGRLEV